MVLRLHRKIRSQGRRSRTGTSEASTETIRLCRVVLHEVTQTGKTAFRGDVETTATTTEVLHAVVLHRVGGVRGGGGHLTISDGQRQGAWSDD